MSKPSPTPSSASPLPDLGLEQLPYFPVFRFERISYAERQACSFPILRSKRTSYPKRHFFLEMIKYFDSMQACAMNSITSKRWGEAMSLSVLARILSLTLP
jgi:hypothetical protein